MPGGGVHKVRRLGLRLDTEKKKRRMAQGENTRVTAATPPRVDPDAAESQWFCTNC